MTLTRLVRGIAVACAMASFAHAQTVQQAGPWAGGHVPAYQMGGGMSSPFVSDGGPAGGGARNPVQEMGLVAPPYQNGNLPPFAGTGTGPLGTNWCDYDGPLSSAAGYHYLCMSPNSSSGFGTITYGAVGASALPLYFVINGISYNVAQSLPAFEPNAVLVSGGTQTMWSTTLPNSLNLQTPSSIDLANATFCGIGTCVSGLGTGVAAALQLPVNTTGGVVTLPAGSVFPTIPSAGLTANLPVIGNGTTALAQGTRSGNTTEFATATGSLVNGDCVSINGGNFIDAGGPCTIGGGGGTVSAGTTGQLAYYASSGTVVTGTNLIPGGTSSPQFYQGQTQSGVSWINSPYLLGSGGTNSVSSYSVAPPLGGSGDMWGASITAIRTSDNTNAAVSSLIGATCLNVADNTSISMKSWCQYMETWVPSGSDYYTVLGVENSVNNQTGSSALAVDPFTTDQTKEIDADRIDSGVGSAAGDVSSYIHLINNGGKSISGIVIGNASLDNVTNPHAPAIAMACQQHEIVWYNSHASPGFGMYADCSGNLVLTVNGSFLAEFTSTGNLVGLSTTQYVPVSISALPACNSGTVGSSAWINNGITAPTYHLSTVGSGTGSAIWPVSCVFNGSLYGWVY